MVLKRVDIVMSSHDLFCVSSGREKEVSRSVDCCGIAAFHCSIDFLTSIIWFLLCCSDRRRSRKRICCTTYCELHNRIENQLQLIIKLYIPVFRFHFFFSLFPTWSRVRVTRWNWNWKEKNKKSSPLSTNQHSKRHIKCYVCRYFLVQTSQFETLFRDTMNRLHESFFGRASNWMRKKSWRWMNGKCARHIGIYNVSYAIWKWVFCAASISGGLLRSAFRLAAIECAIFFRRDCHLKRKKKTFSAKALRDL